MKKKTDSRGRLSLRRILCIVLCLCLISGNKRVSEGTSYSAALVTARAARLLQKNKNLTPAQLREKPLNKAKQLDSGILVLN